MLNILVLNKTVHLYIHNYLHVIHSLICLNMIVNTALNYIDYEQCHLCVFFFTINIEFISTPLLIRIFIHCRYFIIVYKKSRKKENNKHEN